MNAVELKNLQAPLKEEIQIGTRVRTNYFKGNRKNQRWNFLQSGNRPGFH